jgi:hypothetical protein
MPPAPTVPPASPAATVPANAVATPVPPEALLGLSPDSLLVLASALVLVAIVMLAGLILWLAGQRVRLRTAVRPAAAPAREVATRHAGGPAPPPAGPLIEFEACPAARSASTSAARRWRGADSTIRIPAGWPGWESVRAATRIVHEVAHGHTRRHRRPRLRKRPLRQRPSHRPQRTARRLARPLGRLTFTYRSGESRAERGRPSRDPADRARRPTRRERAEPAGMIQCPHCQAENEADAVVCARCDTPLGDQTTRPMRPVSDTRPLSGDTVR